VTAKEWPIDGCSQPSKPREYVYHASLPFQGKSLPRPFGVGWGMGSERSPDARFLPRPMVNSSLAVGLHQV